MNKTLLLLLVFVNIVLTACTATSTSAISPISTSFPSPLPFFTSSPTSQAAPTFSSPNLTGTPPATASPAPTAASPPSLLPQGALAQFGKGEITALALSPDRALLAVGSRAGVCVYRVDGYAEVWCDRIPLWKSTSWIRTLAFRPQGDVLSAGMTGGQVVLWDVQRGARLAERAFSQYEFVNGLAWSPDGSQLAIGSNHLQIALWDGVSLELGVRPKHGPTLINAVSWSPDGQTLVWGEFTGMLTLWNLAAGEVITSLELSSRNLVNAFFWATDGELIVVHGSFLASGCCYAMSGGLTILDSQTGEIIREFDSLRWFEQENDLVLASLSPNGKALAVGGGYYGEEGVAVLDLVTGELLASLPQAKREGGIVWVDAHRVLTVQGQTLVEWDWQTGDVTPVFTDYYASAMSAAWSPDGDRLASIHPEYIDRTSRIVVWNAQTGVEMHTLHRDSWVAQVWWSADGAELLWAEAGDQIYGWDPATGEIRSHALASHQRYMPIAPSPDGTRLAVAEFGVLNLWDLRDGRQQYRIELGGEIGCVAWSPDGALLALCHWAEGGAEGTIEILNALTGERETTIRPEFAVQALSWSADETRLAGNMGGWLAGWDVQSGRQLWKTSVDPDGRPIASVAFSPQKGVLATGGQNVALWDAPRLLSNIPRATLIGQGTPIYGVLFNPDGSLLASLSDDGTIAIWDVIIVSSLFTATS